MNSAHCSAISGRALQLSRRESTARTNGTLSQIRTQSPWRTRPRKPLSQLTVAMCDTFRMDVRILADEQAIYEWPDQLSPIASPDWDVLLVSRVTIGLLRETSMLMADGSVRAWSLNIKTGERI